MQRRSQQRDSARALSVVIPVRRIVDGHNDNMAESSDHCSNRAQIVSAVYAGDHFANGAIVRMSIRRLLGTTGMSAAIHLVALVLVIRRSALQLQVC
jgi:hypothetical protein